MKQLIFDYWDIKYGFFESYFEDIKFCTSSINYLRHKGFSWDIFLRPLRIEYFQQRLEWLLDIKREAEEIENKKNI